LTAAGTVTGFAHLHVASSFSLRYGTASPAKLVARAAELGMPALALTDRDGLYGAFKHVRACADAGIKPLLGADLALRYGQDGGGGDGGPATGRVTLLAAGRQGWASLCRLVSAAHAAHAAQAATSATHPAQAAADRDDVSAVTPALIAEHAAGLIVLLGPASDVGQAIAARRPDRASKALARWRWHTDAVVEIVDHLEPHSTFRAARMAELAAAVQVPAVLTNAVRYLDPAGSLAAQVLDAARRLVPLGSPQLVPHNGRAWLAGPADMSVIARRVAAAMSGRRASGVAIGLLQATADLAADCALDPAADLGIGARHLPETQGDVARQQQELRARCEHAITRGRYRSAVSRPRGTSRRIAARTARERLDHELDIIERTRMAPYFLTVADVADRIRERGIRCAIRGSGAGSFVNHLLGISAIDPIEHDLLMERFLSPVRSTLPDIDLDVESARRLEAYRVIFGAYGQKRTACVCMMETYRARSAIRDVAAAMSLPPDEIGAIAKAFPHIRAKDITAALTELPELRRSRLAGPQLATIFGLAQQLDGLPRHVAMHPCGVLLSDTTLLDRTAVQRSAEGFPLSQLDKDDAEIAGVIKLDVLGVRMQSAMAYTLTEISRTTGESIDLDAIRRDDEDTYAMIQQSRTIGCFQVESPGQRELVKKLAPRDIADLIVDISLFRPGPVNSDMINPFLRARHGLAEPRFPHPELRPALGETGGVVVFHEQVLRIIDVMTGCGLPDADLVRRHLSTEDGPRRTEPWFRAQALARGFDPVTVARVWEVVAAFGGFGFCKAHAAAFAIPVYQSAWLKRHHPAAFYAGVLTHDPGMYPKRVIVQDARLAGIEVLGVDVNASAGEWRVENPSSRTYAAGSEAIRVSLREVKGISDAEVDRIVSGQPYTCLRDFWERARVSRPVAERLVLTGALDCLYAVPDYAVPDYAVPDYAAPGPADSRSAPADPARERPTRRDLLARVGVLARRDSPARRAPALDLFADAESADGMAGLVPAGELRDLEPAERVEAELEILGFDVSRHVLGFYADLLDGLGVVRSADLDDRADGEMVLVAGVKVATQTPAVRSGQRIIFASLDDAAGLVDLAFFESVQDRCAARVFGSWLLVVRGRVRRAGAGPMAVTVNATECWDIPALEELRLASGLPAVRAAMAAGDVGPGAPPAAEATPAAPAATGASPAAAGNASPATPAAVGASPAVAAAGDASPATPAAVGASPAAAAAGDASPGTPAAADAGPGTPSPAQDADWPWVSEDWPGMPFGTDDPADGEAAGTYSAGATSADDPAGGRAAAGRRVVFANGFTLSPYAETGGPGGSPKKPPRTLWHASPGSTKPPD
jgi:error-prone DNA polymerase